MSLYRHFVFFIFACLFLLAASCSQKPQKLRQAREDRSLEYKKDHARFKNAKVRPYRARKYDIQGAFDWEKKILNVRQVISLDLIEDVNALSFDANGPVLSSVAVLHNNVESAATFKMLEGEVEILVPTKVLSGEKIELIVHYTVNMNIDPDDETRMFYQGIFLYEGVGADPVKSQVLYTASEPSSASTWMLCDDHPQRRAAFRTEFLHSKDERFLANGHFLGSTFVTTDKGTQARTIYETEHTVPTYLMAFALGDFICAEEVMPSGLPTQYCMRRGLPGSPSENLKVTNKYLTAIEEKLGAYPWEKYSTVLIPEFPAGGLENAGITFNNEDLVDMTGYRGANVAAHELAHQWFGDYVTVKTWDDLWINEGMATFVADEIVVPFGKRATETNPLFFHQTWPFEPGDGIIDTSLAPMEKYTSGPYDRAAWFFSQLRSLVGKERFWELMRKVLSENRFSHIGTEEFLEYFLADLKGVDKATLLKALHAKDLSKLTIRKEDERKYSISFEDPSASTLVVPQLKKVSLMGEDSFFALEDAALSLDLNSSFLSIDPLSIHGPLYYFKLDEQRDLWTEATSLPTSALNRESLVASMQGLNARERITLLEESFTLESLLDLEVFFEKSESRYESNMLMQALCFREERSENVRSLLSKEASKMLEAPESYGFSLQSCNSSLDEALWSAFDAAPGIEETRITKYADLGMDVERAKNVWIPLLASEGSLSMKRHVVFTLDEKFVMSEISTLSREERAELSSLLSVQIPFYEGTSEVRTLKKIVKNLNLTER